MFKVLKAECFEFVLRLAKLNPVLGLANSTPLEIQHYHCYVDTHSPSERQQLCNTLSAVSYV